MILQNSDNQALESEEGIAQYNYRITATSRLRFLDLENSLSTNNSNKGPSSL
jgi:hypothetical protein